jgi:acetoin utilization protein AcuB
MKRHISQVQEVMTENPIVISPGASLADAYALMFDNEIRRLPVVVDNELVGIITLSDIQRTIPPSLEDADMQTRLAIVARKVGDEMTNDPVTIAPDDTIQEAAARMLEYQVSGLPVVQEGRVVGIITESDIFKLIVNGWSREDGM